MDKQIANLGAQTATSTGLVANPAGVVNVGVVDEPAVPVLPAAYRERFTHIAASPETLAKFRTRQSM